MSAIAVVLAVLALAACGDVPTNTGGGGASSETPPPPTDELVLRVETGGGLVPVELALRALPSFSLYGNGRVITEGPQIAIYPSPALPNLLERSVSDEGVQAILAEAERAGLLGPDRSYELPGTADVPVTTFTVVADGVTHTTSVTGLGAEESGAVNLSDDELAARRAIAEFNTKLLDLASWLPAGSVGEEAPFDFAELRLYSSPYEVTQEPGLEQEPKPWPLGEPLAAFGEPAGGALADLRCGVVTGEELATLLPVAVTSNEITPWTSGGESYLLVFRPLLPDEHGC
jgi:hypothetical protein